MGIAKRSGHRLKAIYMNLSESNVKIFIKRTRSVAEKLTETKKPPENLFISTEGHKTSTNSSVCHCFQQLTYLVTMVFGDSPAIAGYELKVG